MPCALGCPESKAETIAPLSTPALILILFYYYYFFAPVNKAKCLVCIDDSQFKGVFKI